jgi:hypothetical protein
MRDELHTAMLNSGIEACPHDPPCHMPITWVQLLAYATVNDMLIEIQTTLRMVKP